MVTKNENCLEGMRCPKCQSDGPFWIAATITAQVLMSDDGTVEERPEGTTWDDNSSCRCPECGFALVVGDFREAQSAPQVLPKEAKPAPHLPAVVVVPSVDDNGQPDNYICTVPEGMSFKDAMPLAERLVRQAAAEVATGNYDDMITAMDEVFSDAGFGIVTWGSSVDWRVAEDDAMSGVEI